MQGNGGGVASLIQDNIVSQSNREGVVVKKTEQVEAQTR